ncbi:MAG: hypothetical protein AMJ53_14080 [Gammaproteobacteria bacterium SG8_11]|nr:MAG: hypothetical protein AMJ53_14080 [Gammaproteobacteria bacterium SG8_11]
MDLLTVGRCGVSNDFNPYCGKTAKPENTLVFFNLGLLRCQTSPLVSFDQIVLLLLLVLNLSR